MMLFIVNFVVLNNLYFYVASNCVFLIIYFEFIRTNTTFIELN